MHLPRSSARLCFPPAVSAAPHPQGSRLGQPLPWQPHPSVAGSPAPVFPIGCRAEQAKNKGAAEQQRIRTRFTDIHTALGPCTLRFISFPEHPCDVDVLFIHHLHFPDKNTEAEMLNDLKFPHLLSGSHRGLRTLRMIFLFAHANLTVAIPDLRLFQTLLVEDVSITEPQHQSSSVEGSVAGSLGFQGMSRDSTAHSPLPSALALERCTVLNLSQPLARLLVKT